MSSQSLKRKHSPSPEPQPPPPPSKNPHLQKHNNKPPHDSNTQNPQPLCPTCQTINFSTIFTTPITEKHGKVITPITSLSPKCPFCTFLSKIIALSPNTTTNETTYTLQALPSLKALAHQTSQKNISSMPHITPTTVLGLIPSPSTSQRSKTSYQNMVKKWGYISRTTFPPTVTEPHMTARHILPDVIDFSLPKTWLTFCKTWHKKTCTRLSQNMNERPRLRLINCETRSIVTETPGQQNPYIVLSYVWGQSTSSSPSKSNKTTSSSTLPPTLPAVITDAMTVVKQLGYTYLWIDRYCIVQSDESDVLKHMEIMDLIYNCAEVTIVAAGGGGAEGGLAGVGGWVNMGAEGEVGGGGQGEMGEEGKVGVKRIEQPMVKIGDVEIVSTLPDPQDEVARSVWMTRGWTYQEALFSTRRLIFTPTQVYFECNNMHVCETISLPLPQLHTTDQRRFRTCLRHGLFRGGFGKRCHPLSTHIVQYSSRKLSYDTDILRGMFGIFRAFEMGRVPVHNVMGVPVEYDLDLLNWKQQDGMRTQYVNQPWKLHASFARGLCWRLKGVGERRDGFPSWSWAGWKGGVGEWFVFEGLSRWEDPEVRFEVAVEGGGMTDLAALYKSATGKQIRISRESESLGVEAWSFPITILQNSAESLSFLVQVRLSTGDTMFSNLILSSLVSYDELREQKWTCLILAYRKQASRSPVAMVIGEKDGVWERLGLVDFWVSWKLDEQGNRKQEVFNDQQMEKTRWKAVLK